MPEAERAREAPAPREPLGRSFFARSVHEVAPELIGAELRFRGAGGLIVEVEAYAADDPASHGYRRKSARNASMFGPPAHAYVYLSYGIHTCLNFVTGAEGVPEAVLIRALEPTFGLEEMRRRRGGRPDLELCSGPGRLCQALGIGLEADGARLDAQPFSLRARESVVAVTACPRVGISRATEQPWRFCAPSPYVSRPRPGLSRPVGVGPPREEGGPERRRPPQERVPGPE